MKKVALLVDGENMIMARDFSIDLEQIEEAAKKHGSLQIKEVFLPKSVKDSTMDYVTVSGFHALGCSHPDTEMIVRGTEIAISRKYNEIAIIALATRDEDFTPVVHKIKEYNKTSVNITVPIKFSKGLTKAADYCEFIEPLERKEKEV